jgi:hypothetical protein
MNDTLANFIRANHIDSFQKLRFLLFLHQNPEVAGTCQQFAGRLYLGDLDLLKKIIRDLQETNLLNCSESRCKLRDTPEIKTELEGLAKAFEDPLSRQEIIDQVRYHNSIYYYQENDYGPR